MAKSSHSQASGMKGVFSHTWVTMLSSHAYSSQTDSNSQAFFFLGLSLRLTLAFRGSLTLVLTCPLSRVFCLCGCSFFDTLAKADLQSLRNKQTSYGKNKLPAINNVCVQSTEGEALPRLKPYSPVKMGNAVVFLWAL